MKSKKITFSLAERLLNLIAPRSCVMCGSRLTISENTLCADCNMHLPRTNYHLSPTDNELVRIFWGRFPITSGTSFLLHVPSSASARIIYELKYGNKPQIGLSLGKAIAEEYLPTGFFNGITALFPVPLSRRRLMQRGYNQSLEIARGINNATNLPIIDGAIKRRRFRSSQTSKSRIERNENVANDFKLIDQQKINGQHLLIIDDIVTTGATIVALATELLKAPNVEISVFTIGVANSLVA